VKDFPNARGVTMIYRKGETTKRQIDRDYRYRVAIRIPLGGLGTSLTAMHSFADALTPDYKTRPDRRNVSHFIRFCFAEAEHVDLFEATFGGERIIIEPL
jgi:hypothetical protein